MIGIVTLYDNVNIGNKLQNYAVQEILKNYSSNVTTLTYKEAKLTAPDKIGIKGRVASIIGFPKNIAREKRNIINRRNKFFEFSTKYIATEPPRKFREYSNMDINSYDAFVVGSDQVWHNWTDTIDELNYFFLEFAPKNKRICLAPSFGFDDFPKKYIDEYIKGLNGFNYLSCREVSGCNIILKYAKNRAELLLDPTLILPLSKWRQIEKKPDYNLPDKYVLVYFLGYKTAEQLKDIRNITKAYEAESIDIYDLDYPDYYCTTPDEFIYLIDHAQFVCTDSFHGLAFSILFHKMFKSYSRSGFAGNIMSNRQNTILNYFGLGSFVKSYEDFSDIDLKLKEGREKYKSYLEKNFSNIGLAK